MVRTTAAYVLAAAVVIPMWARLDGGDFPLAQVVVLGLLAFLPALAVALRKRRAIVGVAIVASVLVAASVAFEISVGEARPRDGAHDFFGPVLSAFRQGSLDFFDTQVPFDPVEFPEMRGVVLFAAFGFAAAAGLAIALGHPFFALAAVVVGAGWPATMISTWVETSRPLLTGALILAAALGVLVLMRAHTRGLAHAAAAAAVLVAASVGFSTTDAVAKRGFVDWDSWDFYDRPDDPVDVSYVWDGNYDGIRFPKEKTTVLKVKVPGPRRSLYWRATTLDEYTGRIWREELASLGSGAGDEPIDALEADPLLPAAARDRESWIRQDVTVEALDEPRLVGSAQAVRWEPSSRAPATLAGNGAVVLGEPLRRGQRYTVWSYVPRVRAQELSESGTDYPAEALEYLAAFPGDSFDPLPAFGTAGREDYMREEVFEPSVFMDGGAHRRVWQVARRLTADAGSPYEAAVLVESWLRGTEGGFVYDETPPFSGESAPLVGFLETRRGYCQHFAGAMALMLRYLGIPARVAAGFTSGTYDEDEEEWTVTDHNAHTWVEVYFPRFGWVPFDPTPNRGQLTAAYTPFSPAFNAQDAAGLGALLDVPEIRAAGANSRAPEGAGIGPGGTGGGSGVAGKVTGTGGSILGLLVVVVGGLAGALVVAKELRRRIRFAGRDPRGLAGAYRRDLVGFLVDQGIDVPPSATPRELGEIVQKAFAANPDPFVGALAEARYGPPDGARERVRAARGELRRLRRRMSSQLSLGRRVRGALSVRSLAA